jgi:hypothetical protein
MEDEEYKMSDTNPALDENTILKHNKRRYGSI